MNQINPDVKDENSIAIILVFLLPQLIEILDWTSSKGEYIWITIYFIQGYDKKIFIG